MDAETRAWTRLIAQVALMPDVIARLEATHVDDGNGRCSACTTPGRGTPAIRWPCGPASVAIAAQRVRAATDARLAAVAATVSVMAP